jgi:hypothetical protein
MSETEQVREAVAAFTTSEDFEAAIDELLSSGFSRAELSVLASSDAVRKSLGHAFVSTRELEDEPAVPTTAYVARESVGDEEGALVGGLMYVGAFLGLGPVVASGGTIGAAILAAVLAGAGGAAIGGTLAGLIGDAHANRLSAQLQHGGILLWVRTRDGEHENRAREILTKHSGQDVHVHGIPDQKWELKRYYQGPPKEDRIELTKDTYHDVEIIKAPDGHCFALERVFATEADAKRYIVLSEREV